MATVNPTVTDLTGNGSVKMLTYNLTTTDNDGAPFEWVQWADRSVTMTSPAAWGSATCILEGSNDLTSWITLADNGGNVISKTADGVESVVELTRYVRPRLSVPGTAAAIKVCIVCRLNQPLRS